MSTAILETPECLATISANDTALQTHHGLISWADWVIEESAGKPDEELIEEARMAKALESAAFRVRGNHGALLKQRIKDRIALSGKAGDETAIGKQMAELAREMGTSKSSLDYDIQIVTTFPEIVRGDTEILDREFYRLALPAPDPRAAILMACEMKDKGTYTVKDFQADVAKLKGGESTDKIKAGHFVRAHLSDEGYAAMVEACKHRNQSPSVVFDQLIIEWRDQHKGARR